MSKNRNTNPKKAGAQITYQHGKTKINGDCENREVMKLIVKEQAHVHYNTQIMLAVRIVGSVFVTILVIMFLSAGGTASTGWVEMLSGGGGIVRLVIYCLTGK